MEYDGQYYSYLQNPHDFHVYFIYYVILKTKNLELYLTEWYS